MYDVYAQIAIWWLVIPVHVQSNVFTSDMIDRATILLIKTVRCYGREPR